MYLFITKDGAKFEYKDKKVIDKKEVVSKKEKSIAPIKKGPKSYLSSFESDPDALISRELAK